MKLEQLHISVLFVTLVFGCQRSKENISTDDLSVAMKNPESVVSLDLSNQKLTEFPIEITKLINLEHLRLSSNQLQSLPPSIKELKSLVILELDSNNFQEIPKVLTYLPKLSTLSLQHNLISRVDLNPKEWNEIFDLDLACNPIHAVSDQTWLVSIRGIFDLSGTLLREIPLEIFKKFPSEKKVFLPSAITKETRLKIESLGLISRLNLRFSSAASYSWEGQVYDHLNTALSNKAKVEYLDLSNQGLREIPVGIKNLRDLKKIDLSGNSIQTINDVLRDLPNLVSIDLSQNQLTVIESNNLPKSLKYLDVSRNSLVEIKGVYGRFSKMNYLNLAENNFVNSEPLVYFQNLQWLDCSRNNCSNLGKDLIEMLPIRVCILPLNLKKECEALEKKIEGSKMIFV